MKVLEFLDLRPLFKDLFMRRYSAVRSAFVSFMAALIALDQDLWAMYAFIALPITEGFLRYATSRFESKSERDTGIEKSYDLMFTFAFMYVLTKTYLIAGPEASQASFLLYLTGWIFFYIFTMVMIYHWKEKGNSEDMKV